MGPHIDSTPPGVVSALTNPLQKIDPGLRNIPSVWNSPVIRPDASVESVRSVDHSSTEVIGVDSTDTQLISAISHRNEDAYAELFRRHSGSVAAASRMILGSGSDSEDVVAEVFVAFWLSPTNFDPSRSSLLGFLRMKAKGRSIDVLRTLTARRRREDRDAFLHQDQSPQMDESLMAAEVSVQIHLAIDTLPSDEQVAIRLAYFTGLTYVAVAQTLGIPEGTVKSRIRRGLLRLANSADLLAQSQNHPFESERPMHSLEKRGQA